MSLERGDEPEEAEAAALRAMEIAMNGIRSVTPGSPGRPSTAPEPRA
jgi:hypothetical protein